MAVAALWRRLPVALSRRLTAQRAAAVSHELCASRSRGTGPGGVPRRGGETGGVLGGLPGAAEADGRRHQPLH